MSKPMRILVITSCTKKKAFKTETQLTLEDFRRGPKHVRLRERALSDYMLPAEQMYTGPQQIKLMRGIQACTVREAKLSIDLRILSAGYGLIPGSRRIAPYECTFKEMKPKAIRDEWADFLRLPAAFRECVAADYDLILLLLGAEYLQACSLDANVNFGGPAVAFCSRGSSVTLPKLSNFRAVPIPHSASKNLSLKGEYAARLLKCIVCGTIRIPDLMESDFKLLKRLDQES